MKVAILGASDKPQRYAYKAMKSLEKEGHKVFLVNPTLKEIDGKKTYTSLESLPEDIHTLTMYVNPRISSDMADEIKGLGAKRVIFNPGAENRDLYPKIETSRTKVEEACTLVLINTGQF